MTSTFRVIFTRYDRKACSRVQGAPLFVQAENFRGASDVAGFVLLGLDAANPRLVNVRGVTDGPQFEYDIAAISQEGLGGETIESQLYGMFADDRPAEDEPGYRNAEDQRDFEDIETRRNEAAARAERNAKLRGEAA